MSFDGSTPHLSPSVGPHAPWAALCGEEFLTPSASDFQDFAGLEALLEQDSRPCLPSFSTNGSKSSPPPSFTGLESTSDDDSSRAIRRRAYSLRSSSRNMVGDLHDSLACCGFVRSTFRPHGSLGGDPDTAVLVIRKDGRAGFSGVTRCNSPWSCPTCAPRISSARGQVLQPQVARFMAEGWTAWSITLTVRHTRQDTLAGTFTTMGKALSRVLSGKRYAAVKAKGFEFVRGWDVTHSERNGWHPHGHMMVLLSPEHADPKAVARGILGQWIGSLSRLGMKAIPGAQHVIQANNPEAAARYAVTPAACYESVSLALKRARKGSSSRTPFEVLEAAAAGDGRAFHLWREYVAAVKGRKQVNVSKGLFLKEPPEDELEILDGQPIAEMGTGAMGELDRRRLSAPLLDAVEKACPEDRCDVARAFLRNLHARDWAICRPLADPPPQEKPEQSVPPRWTVPDPRRGEPNAQEALVIRAYQMWRATQAQA